MQLIFSFYYSFFFYPTFGLSGLTLHLRNLVSFVMSSGLGWLLGERGIGFGVVDLFKVLGLVDEFGIQKTMKWID